MSGVSQFPIRILMNGLTASKLSAILGLAHRNFLARELLDTEIHTSRLLVKAPTFALELHIMKESVESFACPESDSTGPSKPVQLDLPSSKSSSDNNK